MNKPSNNKIYFTTREVIEIQSLFYYQINEDLGFNSLANTVIEYPYSVYNLFDRILSIYNKRAVNIIELGPGTLFFAKELLHLLRNNDYKVNYTIVDINKSLEHKCNDLGVNFINSSFEKFSRSNNHQFDFILMNQALDMWAGVNSIVYKNKNYAINWKLYNFETNNFLTLQDIYDFAFKQDNNNLFWIKYYKTSKKGISSLKFFPQGQELINLPYSFYHLLQKVRFGGIIQDYWNFDKNVSLRAGLSSVDCSHLLSIFPMNKQREIIQNNHLAIVSQNKLLNVVKYQNIEILNWFNSNIIPFGKIDVTYSPQIFRIASLIEKLGFNFEVLTIKNLVAKLFSSDKAKNIDENQYGSEKNIILFEKKYLLGRSL